MEFFKQLPIAALQVDREGHILEINVRAQSLFGVSESLSGNKFYHYISDQDIPKFFTFFEGIVFNPDICLTTSLQLPDDGNNAPVTVRGAVLGDKNRILTIERCDACGPGCGKKCDYTAALETQFENNPNGILLTDGDMKIISFNREFARIWKIPLEIQKTYEDEVVFKSILDMLDDSDAFMTAFRTAYKKPDTIGSDEVCVNDGRTFTLYSYPVYNNGTNPGRVFIFHDSSELKTAARRLETQEIFQDAILDHIQDGVIACDPEGRISLFNRASQEFFGIIASDELPDSITQLEMYSQEALPIPVEKLPLTVTLSGNTVNGAEVMTRTKAGLYHKLLVSGRPLNDSGNNPLGAVVFLHNISNQELTRQQLHFLAYHDSLTGLPNRRLFHDLMEQCLKQAHRNNLQVGVLFLDLDNFKIVNDTHGHGVGDQILIKVASCLNQHLRESDIICRWGGDEFVIGLLDSNGRDSILKVAEKLGRAVYDHLHLDNHAQKISISIGISIFPDHGPLPDRLIRNADVAMYSAKRRGKNRCEVFTLT